MALPEVNLKPGHQLLPSDTAPYAYIGVQRSATRIAVAAMPPVLRYTAVIT